MPTIPPRNFISRAHNTATKLYFACPQYRHETLFRVPTIPPQNFISRAHNTAKKNFISRAHNTATKFYFACPQYRHKTLFCVPTIPPGNFISRAHNTARKLYSARPQYRQLRKLAQTQTDVYSSFDLCRIRDHRPHRQTDCGMRYLNLCYSVRELQRPTC